MIDWAKAQRSLVRAGYDAGAPDGVDGPRTYTAWFAFAAARQPDAIIQQLGRAGAAWLHGDAIAQTPQRLAEFTAQCANETGGFRRFEEDLSYSAQALANTWARFSATGRRGGPPNALAKSLAYKPEAIAKATYGLRMGNVGATDDTDEHEDGWQYRGRGMLQLTGRDNYHTYGQLLGMPLEVNPDLAADPTVSLVIAREFWRRGRVNDAIDRGDFHKARQITNGASAIGLEAVAARRARLLEVLHG